MRSRGRRNLRESKIDFDTLPIRTEYEVGFNRYIQYVTSIANEIRKYQNLGYASTGYISEKLDKAIHVANEYSRDLYLEMFNEKADFDYKEQVYDQAQQIDRGVSSAITRWITKDVQSEAEIVGVEAIRSGLSSITVLLDRLIVSLDRRGHFTSPVRKNAFADSDFRRIMQEFVDEVDDFLDSL